MPQQIGAGGGSIARVDSMRRITVGPDSAGADPGPAAYDRGGVHPTITDADIVLGKIDPDRFAGGNLTLQTDLARRALETDIGEPLGLTAEMAAFGITEIVDETMSNAARVHAAEQGEDAAEHTLIAFGGAAPLHVGHLAEKLGVSRIVIPTNAGVGSAIGFLRAPVSYEVVRSMHMSLAAFHPEPINRVMSEMSQEALGVVEAGAPGADVVEQRQHRPCPSTASMCRSPIRQLTCFGLRCIVSPEVPNNAGSLAPFKVTAPLRSILNAPYPAAINARHIIGQMLPDVVFGCLVQVKPDRVPAEGASCLWNLTFRGETDRGPNDSTIFITTAVTNGGTGARPTSDGLSATAYPSGVRGTPKDQEDQE